MFHCVSLCFTYSLLYYPGVCYAHIGICACMFSVIRENVGSYLAHIKRHVEVVLKQEDRETKFRYELFGQTQGCFQTAFLLCQSW